MTDLSGPQGKPQDVATGSAACREAPPGWALETTGSGVAATSRGARGRRSSWSAWTEWIPGWRGKYDEGRLVPQHLKNCERAVDSSSLGTSTPPQSP